MIKQYLFIRSHDGSYGGGGSAKLTDEKQAPEKKRAALTGQAEADRIREWKAKYPQGIYASEIDGHVGYFQNPNRQHMNAAMSKASVDSALDMYEMLAKLTFIGGSEEVLENDAMFFGLTQMLKTKMDGKKGQLVNL